MIDYTFIYDLFILAGFITLGLFWSAFVIGFVIGVCQVLQKSMEDIRKSREAKFIKTYFQENQE